MHTFFKGISTVCNANLQTWIWTQAAVFISYNNHYTIILSIYIYIYIYIYIHIYIYIYILHQTKNLVWFYCQETNHHQSPLSLSLPSLKLYKYIWMEVSMCVYMSVCVHPHTCKQIFTNTHTDTHTYIYIY